MATLKTKIKFRRGTFNELKDVVLEVGEPCYVTDTSDYIVGDGSSKVSDLIQAVDAIYSKHTHSISTHTHTMNSAKQGGTISAITPEGTVGVGNGVANYTPSGSINSSFTGTAGNIEVEGTPAGTISTGTGTSNYTPSGTVSIVPNTVSISGLASTGTLPSLTITSTSTSKITSWNAGKVPTRESFTYGKGTSSVTVNNGVLTITNSGTGSAYSVTDVGSVPSLGYSAISVGSASNWAAGELPQSTNTTVVTGIKSASFTGTGTQLLFNGSQSTYSGTFTPSGTITSNFIGTGVELKFSGKSVTPTFTGEEHTHTINGSGVLTTGSPN